MLKEHFHSCFGGLCCAYYAAVSKYFSTHTYTYLVYNLKFKDFLLGASFLTAEILWHVIAVH